MELYSKIKRQTLIIFYRPIIGLILILILGLMVSTRPENFILITMPFVGIWIMFHIRAYRKHKPNFYDEFASLSEEELNKIDIYWREAEKYKYFGNILAVAGDYLVMRVIVMKVKWYVIRLDKIDKVSVIDNSNGAIISLEMMDSDKSIWTGQYRKIQAYKIFNMLNAAIDEKNEKCAFEIESKLFDSKGLYGGSQKIYYHLPEPAKSKQIEMAGRNYGREAFNEKEFYKFIYRLDSEGCGYVAMMNTVFLHYENKPEEFERIFGYPLMAENGDFNFNDFLIDIYSATDNVVNSRGERDYNLDYTKEKDGSLSDYSYWTDMTGRGVTSQELCMYIKYFMGKYNVAVEAEKLEIKLQNIRRYINKGWYILVATGNVAKVRDTSGQTADAAHHWMTITGMTEYHEYIVSSWGGKYYFNPELALDVRYVGIKYTV